MQELGDKIRQIDSKYFINNMLDDLKIYQELVQNVVVADVRYPDEFEEIKLNYDEVYSFIIENQFGKSNLTLEEQSHRTEIALDNYEDYDYLIVNEEMSILKDKIFKILEGIK